MPKLEIPLSDDLTRYAEKCAEEAHLAPGEYVAALVEADKRQRTTQNRIEEQLLAAQKSLEEGKGIEVNPEYWSNKKDTLLEKINAR